MNLIINLFCLAKLTLYAIKVELKNIFNLLTCFPSSVQLSTATERDINIGQW
jgi:hypothetical protein